MRDEDHTQSAKAREIEALHRRFSGTGRVRGRVRRIVRVIAGFLFIDVVAWTKRALDVLVSGFLVLIVSPLLIVGRIVAGPLRRTPRLGRWGEPFDEFSFETGRNWGGRLFERLHLRRLPVLLNIFRGDMSFVGPLPASPQDATFQEKASRKRYYVRPGLISLWWIRKRANIDYGSENDADAEYVESQGIWNDLAITLRAVPAVLYGEGGAFAPEHLTVLDIPINNVTMSETLDTLMEWISAGHGGQVCFVNADCANIAYRNKIYLEALQKADLCLADGIGLKLAGKILGRPIKQNVNGTDLFPRLCERLSGSGVGMFLLGARAEVVEAVSDWVRGAFPDVTVCGLQHGYFTPEEEAGVIQRIRDSGADILLVAFGAPKQDLWIHDHLEATGVKAAMGVGGLFDFYSGRIPRAPVWMREIGMEWVYRLIQEPGRLWKRYLVGNGLFLWRVVKERFRAKDRTADTPRHWNS